MAAEGTEHFLQSVGGAAEVVQLERLVRGEEEYVDDVSVADHVSVTYEPDDVSVTTVCSVTTQLLEDSYSAEMCGLAASTLPEVGLYHSEEYRPAIEAELRRDPGSVLNLSRFSYNWIGPVSTTLSPWHTS